MEDLTPFVREPAKAGRVSERDVSIFFTLDGPFDIRYCYRYINISIL